MRFRSGATGHCSVQCGGILARALMRGGRETILECRWTEYRVFRPVARPYRLPERNAVCISSGLVCDCVSRFVWREKVKGSSRRVARPEKCLRRQTSRRKRDATQARRCERLSSAGMVPECAHRDIRAPPAIDPAIRCKGGQSRCAKIAVRSANQLEFRLIRGEWVTPACRATMDASAVAGRVPDAPGQGRRFSQASCQQLFEFVNCYRRVNERPAPVLRRRPRGAGPRTGGARHHRGSVPTPQLASPPSG
jgi:hypothetical protein